MTREEAIVDIRDNIKPVVGGKSLDMAIEALEQELFDIETYCKEHFCVMVDKDVWEKAEKALEQEPTVINEIPKDYKYDTETKDFLVYRHKYTGDEIHVEKPIPLYRLKQEPKTGHWKYIQYDKPSIGNWHCSECGRIVFLLKSQKSSENPLYDYCPWCGAKMESEDKE